MTTGQDVPVPFYCPRCGSPMSKHAGSSFYWHSTPNHPSCSITNIAEAPKIAPVNDKAQTTPKKPEKPRKLFS
jgi:hypothetical protein